MGMDDIEKDALREYFDGKYNPETVLLEMTMRHPESFLEVARFQKASHLKIAKEAKIDEREALTREVIAQVGRDNKIEAIKKVRDVTRDVFGKACGLGDAKTLVENEWAKFDRGDWSYDELDHTVINHQKKKIMPSDSEGALLGHGNF